jgi:ATP-binding cassette, subfamily B, multidrug efflux pump
MANQVLKDTFGFVRRWVLLAVGSLCIVNTLELFLPLLLARAIDLISGQGSTDSLWRLAGWYVAIAAVQAALRFGWRYALGHAGAESSEFIRRQVLHGVLKPGMTSSSGEVATLSTSDADAVSRMFSDGVVIGVDAAVMTLGIAGVMIWHAPLLAAVILVPLAMVPILFSVLDGRIRSAYSGSQQRLDALARQAQQSIAAARAIRSLGAASWISDRFRARSKSQAEQMTPLIWFESVIGPLVEIILAAATGVLLIYGGGQFFAGTLSLGLLVAFQRYIQQLNWPLRAASLAIVTIRKGVASTERLTEFVAVAAKQTGEPRSTRSDQTGGAFLQFDHVSFSYETSDAPVLSELSFSLEPGERVALVGEVGAGKSTVVKLLTGTLSPRSGTIRCLGIVGTEPSDLPVVGFSAVPQDPFLFQTTVLENVLFGAACRSVPMSDVEAVCRRAAIHDEILNLPQGYESFIGERGLTLSGGQRQRICLARALIAEPKLLVLDNALAAVDSRTESMILDGLREQRMTVLVITHRISTLRDVDRILVLRDGKIVQDGPLDRLLVDREPWFRDFYGIQQLKERVGDAA